MCSSRRRLSGPVEASNELPKFDHIDRHMPACVTPSAHIVESKLQRCPNIKRNYTRFAVRFVSKRSLMGNVRASRLVNPYLSYGAGCATRTCCVETRTHLTSQQPKLSQACKRHTLLSRDLPCSSSYSSSCCAQSTFLVYLAVPC